MSAAPHDVGEIQMLRTQQALDAQHVQLLLERIHDLEAALKLEQARSEKLSDSLTQIARFGDTRVRDLEMRHAAAYGKSFEQLQEAAAAKDAMMQAHAAACAAKDAKITKLEAKCDSGLRKLEIQQEVISKLETEVAVLKAQAAEKIGEIHAAVTRPKTLEMHPKRHDGRQFVAWHNGPVPPLSSPLKFDRAWAAELCRTGDGDVSVDVATNERVSVSLPQAYFDTRYDADRRALPERVPYLVTLRSDAPMPRCLPPARDGVAHGDKQQLPQRQSAPRYRVVIESYANDGPPNFSGSNSNCRLGFIPCHATRPDGPGPRFLREPVLVTPSLQRDILEYCGWYIDVYASHTVAHLPSCWVAVPAPSALGALATDADTYSAYATTTQVPPVPAGSAVEFAVDYAAGTCRVAFYTPAAVAGGFVEPPYAKMELRFVATMNTYPGEVHGPDERSPRYIQGDRWGPVLPPSPIRERNLELRRRGGAVVAMAARPVPETGTELYPAVGLTFGSVVRFVA